MVLTKEDYPTFEEFMRDEAMPIQGHLLVQALAKLSVLPPYADMEPGEIYDLVVEQDRAVRAG